jgi:hypothetical protein
MTPESFDMYVKVLELCSKLKGGCENCTTKKICVDVFDKIVDRD